MNRIRPGFIALILLFGATLLVPALHTDIARAAPAWMDNLTVTKLLDSPTDYRWMGTWDPVYDYDWQRHYSNAYVPVCASCAVHDLDRSAPRACDSCAVRDCDRCVVRDCDSCDRYINASDYYCDLYGCAWVR